LIVWEKEQSVYPVEARYTPHLRRTFRKAVRTIFGGRDASDATISSGKLSGLPNVEDDEHPSCRARAAD
jgi:hypothetical protein